ncbi:MAG: hypothetical protein P8P74_08620 [Crocinitomicaceae bacterium]|nr:hypothetical protein [Crocinitomicaceae bacterium]
MNKPTPEAKALSLFLMAHKKTNSSYKEKAKRINKQWDLVVSGELSKEDYFEEVQQALDSYGGYSEVIEKTVRFYIDSTGEWKLKGDDKYCLDAQKIADKIMKHS